MPTRKQGTTLITRVCFHTSTKALATLFGTCPNSLSKWSAISSTTAQAPFLTRNTLSALKCLPAFSVHSVSKQIVLSIFSQRVSIQSSQVWSLNAIMLPVGLLWKPSAKALWQAVWSIWLLAVLPVWPYKTFKSPSMLITGHYPAGFLMLVYLLEINSPLVALVPFWSLPYLLKNTNRLSLLIYTTGTVALAGASLETTQQRCTWSSMSTRASLREIHLVEVKYCKDTRPGQPLENNMKFFASAWKPRKLSFTLFLLV